MKVLAFLAACPGVGEMWLASQVAMEAERHEHGPVVLLDVGCDRQHSHREGIAAFGDVRSLPVTDVPHQLAMASSEGVALTIIAAHIPTDEMFTSVIDQSDLVVITLLPNNSKMPNVKKLLK